MKKLAKIIEMIGTVVFLFCICIDATEYPVTAIPVLIGLLLIYIGTKIDGEWQEYTEEIVDYDYRSESDDDDGITYITFDTDYSKENGRIQSRGYIKKYEDGTEEQRTAYEVSVSKINVLEEEN